MAEENWDDLQDAAGERRVSRSRRILAGVAWQAGKLRKFGRPMLFQSRHRQTLTGSFSQVVPRLRLSQFGILQGVLFPLRLFFCLYLFSTIAIRENSAY